MNLNQFPHEPEEPQNYPLYTPMVYVKKQEEWEYHQLSRDLAAGENPPTEDELNALGKEGWELSGVLPHNNQVFFYFKRLVN